MDSSVVGILMPAMSLATVPQLAWGDADEGPASVAGTKETEDQMELRGHIGEDRRWRAGLRLRC